MAAHVLLGLLIVVSAPGISLDVPDPPHFQHGGVQTSQQQHNSRQFYIKDDMIVNLVHEASLGVDPFMLDHTEILDSGVREAIFQPTQFVDTDKILLHNFMNIPREKVQCQGYVTPKFHHSSGIKFRDYIEFQIPSVEVVSDVNILDKLNRSLPLNPAFDYINGTNKYKDQVILYLADRSGEIVQKKSYCHTHTVTKNLHSIPIFSQPFLQGLRSLNIAAKQPQSESSRETFKDFIKTFGSHFQISTHFGSAIFYERLYSSLPINENENEKRRKCASIAIKFAARFHSSLYDSPERSTPMLDELEKCELAHENHDRTEDSKLPSTKLLSLGTTELNGSPQSRGLKISPSAIHYKLKSIVSLFKEEWFNTLIGNDNDNREILNGTAIYDFFEYSMAHYCEIMLGAPCYVFADSCGRFSNCSSEEECIEDFSDVGFHCKRHQNSTSAPDYGCANRNREPKCDTCQICRINDLCGPDFNCYEEPYSCKGYICVYSGPGEFN